MHLTTISKEQADSFLQKLRLATSPMHQKLEESQLSKNLLKEDVTIEDYTTYLQRMKGVVTFCETNIFPAIANIIPDSEERIKLPLLEADLDYFEKNNEAGLNYSPFEIATPPYALGYLYVIEGSVLGGRVILKHLGPRLQISQEKGGSFFAGYKEDTSAKWKSFLQYFTHYAVNHHSGEEIIAGAQDAFETIHCHFES